MLWVVWQVDHHQHTADLQWLRVLRALDRFTLMLLLALEWCVKHLFMHETSVKTLVKVELKSENYSYQGSLWNVQWYEDIWDVRNSPCSFYGTQLWPLWTWKNLNAQVINVCWRREVLDDLIFGTSRSSSWRLFLQPYNQLKCVNSSTTLQRCIMHLIYGSHCTFFS